MNSKHSIRFLFLMICAIHLNECYPSDDEDYQSDDYIYSKQAKKEATPAPPAQPPKDFFIPKLSFVPYSKISSASIRRQEPPAPAPAPTTKAPKKKAPCNDPSHRRSEDVDDYTESHEGDHNDDYEYGRGRGQRARPQVRAQGYGGSHERHQSPRIREFINKYTIDLVENSPKHYA